MRSETNTAVDIEQSLIRRVLSGEKELFADLIRPHAACLRRFVFRLLPRDEDVEEVVQTTWCKAFQHLGQFRIEASFRTWLTKIAINEARGLRRGSRNRFWLSLERWNGAEPAVPLPHTWAGWVISPPELVHRQQLRAALHTAVLGLPRRYREVILMRSFEGRSVGEAAQLLGIAPQTVKTRHFRAVRLLRGRLSPHLCLPTEKHRRRSSSKPLSGPDRE